MKGGALAPSFLCAFFAVQTLTRRPKRGIIPDEVMEMELLDLYDRAGNPLGKTLERGPGLPQAAEGEYWRVCDVWLVNDSGELLIQRRALSKPNWPGAWCESAGGAIRSGETPEEGMLRETMEEIGVRPDLHRGGLVFTYTGRTAHHDVWVFRTDVTLDALTLQEDEVIDARWARPEELIRMEKDGTFVKVGYLEQLVRMLPVLISAYR